jgi:dTMP kinase
MTTLTRGRYIALEGGEGAGKSTLARMVRTRLEAAGRVVRLVREPGGTAAGEGIRRLLLDDGRLEPWTEALLFAAQRAELAAEVIKPALERGEWVVADRSYYSSLAYQGIARGLGLEKVRLLNEWGLAGVVPDLVVVLMVDPIDGLARQDHPDRIGGEGPEFSRAVAAAYHQLGKDEPGRVVLVDAGDPLQAVVERVMEVLS